MDNIMSINGHNNLSSHLYTIDIQSFTIKGMWFDNIA
jgi:hypothetical protein